LINSWRSIINKTSDVVQTNNVVQHRHNLSQANLKAVLSVLSVRPKITDLNFHLFARSIHPELFSACVSREYARENYNLKINITTAGHLIAFEHDGHVLTEVSTSANHPLPTKRVLLSNRIDAAQSDEAVFRNLIEYNCQYQLDGVNPQTFVTIQKQLDAQTQCEGLVHRFQANGRLAFGAISYINVQSFRSRVKIRSFHTFPDTYAVMKSESSFYLLNAA